MRKIFLFINLLVLFVGLCFAGEPTWLKKPEKEYPKSKFLMAIGVAQTPKQAQDDALQEISLFLNAKIEVATTVLKESKSFIDGDKTLFADKVSIHQISNISSNADLFCVNFTESYYDKKKKNYSVLAYINKQDAVTVYHQRILSLIDSVDSYKKYADTENEPFLAAGALQKARILSELAKTYIQTIGTIFPGEDSKYSEQLSVIKKVQEDLESYKNIMIFDFAFPDEKLRSISDKLASILEENGYRCSQKNASYKVCLNYDFIEENYDAGPFVRPNGQIEIKNADGKSVYSYSKAYGRFGGKTLDQAYTRGIFKIKEDLEENFLKEYREISEK